jgi:hypothetical protein
MSSQREDRKNKWWFAIHPKQKERASVIVLLVSAATAHAAFFYIHTSSHSIYIHSQQSVVVVVVVVDRGARRWRKKKNGGRDQTGGGMGPGWRTGLCCGWGRRGVCKVVGGGAPVTWYKNRKELMWQNKRTKKAKWNIVCYFNPPSVPPPPLVTLSLCKHLKEQSDRVLKLRATGPPGWHWVAIPPGGQAPVKQTTPSTQ